MKKLKYTKELAYQKKWARYFKANKVAMLRYWNKYREFKRLNKLCKFDKNTKTLEIGGGISSVLHYLKGKKYLIDPLAEEYKKIYNYPCDINILNEIGESLPFKSGFFDVVISVNSLDHVDILWKVIREIYRVLKKKGYFILYVELFDKKIKRDIGHPFSLMYSDLEKIIKNRYKIKLKRIIPMLSLKGYINHNEYPKQKEIILFLQKD